MKHIQKGREPDSLLAFRQAQGATFENKSAPVTADIRDALLNEQGSLCCYCMSRIGPGSGEMKIEHWHPQNPANEDQHSELAWSNLLAACPGGEGAPRKQQHCDTHKANDPISLDPTDPRCERMIRYLADGTVDADDPFDKDLDTLNLNVAVLVNNRRAALTAMKQGMEKKYRASRWTRAQVDRELSEWSARTAAGFREFCPVAIYWLRKRLARID